MLRQTTENEMICSKRNLHNTRKGPPLFSYQANPGQVKPTEKPKKCREKIGRKHSDRAESAEIFLKCCERKNRRLKPSVFQCFAGEGDGNRTHVRKHIHRSVSERSLYFKFRFRHRLQAGYIVSYPVVPPCCRAFTRSFPVYIMPVISAYR